MILSIIRRGEESALAPLLYCLFCGNLLIICMMWLVNKKLNSVNNKDVFLNNYISVV